MIQIKSINGVVLYTTENATDIRSAVREAVAARADLRRAYLRDAYLRDAYLTGADLRGADLRGAYLRDADLRGAHLTGAYLTGADLTGAKGINTKQHNDLELLRHQVGKIRMFKVVTAEGHGPINGGLKYIVGETVEVKNASTDESVPCAAGIHLATLPWCVRAWRKGHRILLMEFTAKDIAAIPLSDGKFRVRKAKVIRDLDLKELGLT